MERAIPPGRALPAPSPTSRIALVGQDADTRLLLASVLEDEGWQSEACDEKNIFGIIQSEDCEMVLLDLDGVPAGRPLLDLLILDPATSNVPIVACTSHFERLAAMERNVGRHSVELLSKPFTADDLYAAIRTVVGAARETDHGRGSLYLRH